MIKGSISICNPAANIWIVPLSGLSHFNLNITILFLTSVFDIQYQIQNSWDCSICHKLCNPKGKSIQGAEKPGWLGSPAIRKKLFRRFRLCFLAIKQGDRSKNVRQGDSKEIQRQKWWPDWERDERPNKKLRISKSVQTHSHEVGGIRQVRKHAPNSTPQPSKRLGPHRLKFLTEHSNSQGKCLTCSFEW